MSLVKTSNDRVRELEARLLELENSAIEEAKERDEDQNLPPEEKTFKKRYSDLRSHSARQENELRAEIQQLREQLNSATKKTMDFPKTAEEVEAWSKKYPDVYDTIVTIARQNAIDVAKDVQESVQQIQNREHEHAKREAKAELLRKHPDFPDIATSQEFIDWIEEQPRYIYDALYVNETDAGAAIRAVDLYKADTGISSKPPKKEKKESPLDAARQIQRSQSISPGETKLKWTESRVASVNWNRLTSNDIAEIEEARQDPAFYDISGGAR